MLNRLDQRPMIMMLHLLVFELVNTGERSPINIIKNVRSKAYYNCFFPKEIFKWKHKGGDEAALIQRIWFPLIVEDVIKSVDDERLDTIQPSYFKLDLGCLVEKNEHLAHTKPNVGVSIQSISIWFLWLDCPETTKLFNPVAFQNMNRHQDLTW